MKHPMRLGLAALGVVVLMAFAGAGRASATVLCLEQGGGSPTGTTCPSGHASILTIFAHLKSAKMKVTTTFKTIECSKSEFEAPVWNEGSATETVSAGIEHLKFEECNCEVKVLTAGTLEVHWIEGTHNGTVTSKGLSFTATCSTIFGTVHCEYTTGSGGTDLGVITGGNPAIVDIESANIPRLITNALCSETAQMDAQYEIGSPRPLFVAGHT